MSNLDHTVLMQGYLKSADLLAKRLRVLLHLLQDQAHGWVGHDLLHLRISHSSFLHLLGAVVPHGLTDHAPLYAFRCFLRVMTSDEDQNESLQRYIWLKCKPIVLFVMKCESIKQ